MSLIRIFLLVLFFSLLPELSAQYRYSAMQMGRIEAYHKNYTRAIMFFNQFVKEHPNEHEGYYMRALMKYYLDDLHGCEMDVTKAINLLPEFPEPYILRAVVRQDLLDLQGAMGDYSTAIAHDSSFYDAYYYRSMLYLDLREYEKALDDCNKALEHEEHYSNIHVIRGSILAKLERFDESIADFNTALEKDSLNVSVYNQRGASFMQMNRMDSAIADFNTAIRLDTNNSLAYYNRAIAHMSRMESEKAMSDLDKVLEISPGNELAIFNRAILKSNDRNSGGAMQDFAEILRKNPDNLIVLYNLGITHMQLGNYEAAELSFTEAIKVMPEYTDAYQKRALTRDALGKKRESEEDLAIYERLTAELEQADDSTKFLKGVEILKLTQLESDFTSVQERKEKVQYRNFDINLKPNYTLSFNRVTNCNLHAFVPSNHKPYGSKLIMFSEICDSLNLTEAAMRIYDLENNSKIFGPKLMSLLERAMLKAFVDDFEGAIKDIKEAVELDGMNPLVYFCRANIGLRFMENNYYQSDKLELASIDQKWIEDNMNAIIQDYDRALTLDPSFVYSKYNRAYSKYLLEDYQGALEDFSSVTVSEELGPAYYNMGLLSILFNNKSQGCAALSRAGELGVEEAYSIIKQYCQ